MAPSTSSTHERSLRCREGRLSQASECGRLDLFSIFAHRNGHGSSSSSLSADPFSGMPNLQEKIVCIITMMHCHICKSLNWFLWGIQIVSYLEVGDFASGMNGKNAKEA
jgi:hypothetical protein